jgi:hypothetical protein
MGGFASAQSIVPAGSDFDNHQHTFAVNDNAEKTSWVWVEYRTVNFANIAYDGDWIRAAISGVSSGTLVPESKGLWVADNATVTVTLSGMTGKYGWCAYASDTPPSATLIAAGGYDLHGTPPFTVNNVSLADDVKTFGAGTCIATITDATGNPAGIIPPAPAVTTSNPAAICGTGAVTLTATASGGTTTAMTYTWTVGAAAAQTTTANTYSPTVSAGSTYSVTVTNANGCVSAAATGTITVHDVPTVGTTSPATVCYNTAAALSCTVSGGTTTAMTYTWNIGTAISVTTEPAVTTANLTAATTYSVTAANAYGCTSTVATGTIPVYNEFTAGSITTASATTTQSSAPNVTVADATPASGGDGSITYQWLRSGTSPATLTGSAATYALNTEAANYNTYGTVYFNRYAKDGTCNTTFTASSGQYTLTVYPTPPPNSGTDTWTCGRNVWSGALRNAAGCTNVTTINNSYASYKDFDSSNGYYYNSLCVNYYKNALCPSPWRVPAGADIVALVALNAECDLRASWGMPGYAHTNGNVEGYGSMGCIWTTDDCGTTKACILGWSLDREPWWWVLADKQGFNVRCIAPDILPE